MDPPNGYNNSHSICYFNALVQSLLSSKSFLKKISSVVDIEKIRDPNFTYKLLCGMDKLSPNESSSEYFYYLIDFLECQELFEYTYKTLSKCLNCGHESTGKDTTINVLLSKDIIELFDKEERIDGVNCDKCKTKSTVEYRKTISGHSSNIVVSLNKYFDKNKFDYPLNFFINNLEFRLISTIEHMGILNAGHYNSRVRRGDKYYIIDDSNILELPGEFNGSNNTYMLFYELVE